MMYQDYSLFGTETTLNPNQNTTYTGYIKERLPRTQKKVEIGLSTQDYTLFAKHEPFEDREAAAAATPTHNRLTRGYNPNDDTTTKEQGAVTPVGDTWPLLMIAIVYLAYKCKGKLSLLKR